MMLLRSLIALLFFARRASSIALSFSYYNSSFLFLKDLFSSVRFSIILSNEEKSSGMA